MDIPEPNRVGKPPNIASPDNLVVREIQGRLMMMRKMDGGGMRGVISGGSLIAM